MRFESHLTILGGSSVESDWYATCKGYGIKPLKILLSGGVHSSQLMCAARFEAPDPMDGVDLELGLIEKVEADFEIVRSKLESPLHEYAGGHAAYFETHLKCLVPTDRIEPLIALAPERVGVSESIWDPVPGLRKVYLTERSFLLDRDFATFRFTRLFNLFEPVVFSQENEVVWHDSNPDWDYGWLVA